MARIGTYQSFVRHDMDNLLYEFCEAASQFGDDVTFRKFGGATRGFTVYHVYDGDKIKFRVRVEKERER